MTTVVNCEWRWRREVKEKLSLMLIELTRRTGSKGCVGEGKREGKEWSLPYPDDEVDDDDWNINEENEEENEEEDEWRGQQSRWRARVVMMKTPWTTTTMTSRKMKRRRMKNQTHKKEEHMKDTRMMKSGDNDNDISISPTFTYLSPLFPVPRPSTITTIISKLLTK